MQESTTRSIYDLHSRVYDRTFGRLVRRRISAAISHIRVAPDDRILDLGVGTGASMSYFPLDRGLVFGIDLSSGMLDLCRQRMARQGRGNAIVLQGNALELPFAENSFDHVFISHVISVVSDPCRLVREVQRVAKPKARIVIVNHFQSANRLIALVEKWLCPLCTRLGWRSDLPLHELIQQTGAEVDYRFKLEHIDLWETVVLCNNKSLISRSDHLLAGVIR
jgi:phosphatidylethanolamine/phosphatidyl-N-methylethanolamine N-methyltransferase